MPSTCHIGDTVTLPADLVHRLYTVLRMRGGEEVTLFDAMGHKVHVKLGPKQTPKAVVCTLPLASSPAPKPMFTLLIGMPKRDAYERVLRQATELNIAHIQPIITDFSAPDRLKEERAQRIITEAAEQCERLSLPTLHTPLTFAEALKAHTDIWWCFERAAGATGGGGTAPALKPTPSSALCVGAEGGFSPAEVSHLQSRHTPIIDLGTTILRVDTAVVAGLAILQSKLA